MRGQPTMFPATSRRPGIEERSMLASRPEQGCMTDAETSQVDAALLAGHKVALCRGSMKHGAQRPYAGTVRVRSPVGDRQVWKPQRGGTRSRVDPTSRLLTTYLD